MNIGRAFLVLAEIFSYWSTFSVLAEFFKRMMWADLLIQIYTCILLKLLNNIMLLIKLFHIVPVTGPRLAVTVLDRGRKAMSYTADR